MFLTQTHTEEPLQGLTGVLARPTVFAFLNTWPVWLLRIALRHTYGQAGRCEWTGVRAEDSCEERCEWAGVPLKKQEGKDGQYM